ncbi:MULTISPECIES: sigma-70 family RNA polymerase sigma factor [unclassified Nonomuraea]|uniref:RNA polymerase sigma factor n=1 Tax=unclassified Nonomuraea TaxID=2593643 RepID=UPI0033E0823F
MDDPQERFTDLYDRHYRSVLGYALLRAERDAAEDVSSETFLVAWRRLDDLPEPPLPWLLGVARNLLAKQRDSRHRRQALVDRITALTTSRDHVGWDVADHVIDRESALAALSALPEQDVEAMVFATWYGLPPEQAAAVMGCSVRTYNVRLHRARKRLATALRLEPGGTRPQGRTTSATRTAGGRFQEHPET